MLLHKNLKLIILFFVLFSKSTPSLIKIKNNCLKCNKRKLNLITMEILYFQEILIFKLVYWKFNFLLKEKKIFFFPVRNL